MKTKFPHFILSFLCLVTAYEGLSVLSPSKAHAVVGMPLTPGSVAGVARRTTRRTVVAGAAIATAAVATTAAVAHHHSAPVATTATVASISALPAGCVTSVSAGATYHHCGSTYYQPAYDGTNVVYVQTAAP